MITAKSTILESLDAIKSYEMEHHQILMYTDPSISDGSTQINTEPQIIDIYSNDSCESKDLHYNYMFQKHYLTIWMVNMTGFNEFIHQSTIESQMITSEEIYINIKKHETEFISKLDTISYEFKDKRIDPSTISGSIDQALHFKRIVSIVNKYIRLMYGMEIKKVLKKDHVGKYHIKNNANGKLFKIVPYNTPEEDLTAIQIPYILSYLK